MSGIKQEHLSSLSSRASLHQLLCFVLLIGLLSFSADGQVLYGSLTGTVTDASGAVVTGARVTALEVGTGVAQEATTDSSGIYRFATLLPGTYQVDITAPGFSKQESPGVRVGVNAVTRVNAQLKVGSATENVTVTMEAPLLQTDRSDVHTDLNNAQVQSLPSISSEGRSFQALYRIIPGASLPLENNSAGGNPQRAMTSNVNGQSSQGNNTRIDGVLDAYPWLPNNIAYVPPTDGIETVNVTTNSFDAEQGNAAGAWVNVQTKSGTNRLHGDLHELYTGNALSALNYFNPPTFRIPLNVFNQFGAAIGGPIKKDKLFFFGDWESTRQAQAPNGGNPQTVPFGGLMYSAANQAGFFDFRGITDSKGNQVNIYDPRSGAANGNGRSIITCNGVPNEICLADVDPAALAMAKLIPAPNQPGSSNNYFLNKTGFFHRDDFDGKVNYIPNAQSTLFGRYSLSQSNIFDPPALGPAEGNATLGGQLGYADSRIQVLGLGGTYVFSPSLLLDFNAGYTRQRINAESTDIHTNFGSDVLKIPGTNGPDPLQGGIPAFQFNNTFSNLGNPNTGNPFVFRDNQYLGNANMTWVKGKHQLRFGIEYNHTQMNHFQPQGGNFQTARGSFKFTGAATELAGQPSNTQYNSYADFLLGLPDEVGKATQNLNPNALRWSQWAWYARDQYQLTSKLTLNYGLRWEYYPMAYSDIGGARVLDPSTMNVLVGGGSSGIPIDNGVDTGHGLFLPRVGIAYRPLEKTVLRAGYGMSADANNWRFLRNAFPAVTISDFTGFGGNAAAPAASLTGLNAVGPYAGIPVGIPAIALTGGTSPGSFPLPDAVGTTTIAKSFRRGYINTFNLMVERELPGKLILDVGYVGDRGIRPLENMNINPAPANGGQNGRILNAQFNHTTTNTCPTATNPAAKCKGWPDINELIPLGNNYYDSLQSKLTRRFAGASQIGFAYTLSKAINYEDNEEINFLLWPYPAYINRNKALAGFDRTHNFEMYGVYELPFGRGKRYVQSGIGSVLAGGWQLNWVLSAMSGTPFTITDNGAGATFLNAPGNTQTANIVGPLKILNGSPRSSCAKVNGQYNLSCSYLDPNAFQQVTATTPGLLDGFFGNAGRNILRGPGYFNWDMSLMKNVKLTERLTFQFEATAFGVTNTPHFNNPNINISAANFGAVTSTLVTTNASLGGSGGQRQWWFGGRLIF